MTGDPIAAMLAHVARLALSRGIALRKDERAMLERAEALALGALQADPVETLRRFCADRGIQVHPGDMVGTSGAARILGITPGALRNDRGRIPFVRERGRCYYALNVLARHVPSCSPVGERGVLVAMDDFEGRK